MQKRILWLTIAALIAIVALVGAIVCLSQSTPSIPYKESSVDIRRSIYLRSYVDPQLLRSTTQALQGIEWRTDRHSNYPTTDVEVDEVADLESRWEESIGGILRAAAEKYGIPNEHLWLRDSFFVRYSEGQQTQLAAHRDASPLSFVVALNSEYTDGGTRFLDSNETSRLDPGDAAIFSGFRLHEGIKITSGTRLILTGFIDYHGPHELIIRAFTTAPDLLRGYRSERYLFRPHLLYNTRRLASSSSSARKNLLSPIAFRISEQVQGRGAEELSLALRSVKIDTS